jgi:hypothetical protein
VIAIMRIYLYLPFSDLAIYKNKITCAVNMHLTIISLQSQTKEVL